MNEKLEKIIIFLIAAVISAIIFTFIDIDQISPEALAIMIIITIVI